MSTGDKSSPVHEIWRGTRLSRDCTVLVTTRPTKRTDQLMLHSHVQFELNGFDSGDKIKDFVRNFLSDQDVFKSVSNSLQGKATFVNSDKTLRYVSYRSGDKGMQ